MTVTFKTRVHPDGTIAVPKKLKKQVASKMVTVTLAEAAKVRKPDIFDEWMKNPIRVPNFKPLTRDEIYADRCR